MLQVTAEVRDQVLAHAIRGLPNEACGMLSSTANGDVADRFHPLRNAAESATVFALDGKEMLELERSIDDEGRTLVAVMHSHTHTSPYPSPTDVADSGRFDPFGAFSHVIVSLRHAEPSIRSYRIQSEQITEELIVVNDDEPVPHDGTGTGVAQVARLPRPPAE